MTRARVELTVGTLPSAIWVNPTWALLTALPFTLAGIGLASNAVQLAIAVTVTALVVILVVPTVTVTVATVDNYGQAK